MGYGEECYDIRPVAKTFSIRKKIAQLIGLHINKQIPDIEEIWRNQRQRDHFLAYPTFPIKLPNQQVITSSNGLHIGIQQEILM